jgi:hypothetical protein
MSETMPAMNRLRLEDGRREVDIILEAPDGRVVAIETKASAEPNRAYAKHLVGLREQLGDQFATGVVFHIGPLPSPSPKTSMLSRLLPFGIESSLELSAFSVDPTDSSTGAC